MTYRPEQEFEKKSEFRDKAEALLDHDAQREIQSGAIKTKKDLERYANESGYVTVTDKKLIEHIANKKGLK